MAADEADHGAFGDGEVNALQHMPLGQGPLVVAEHAEAPGPDGGVGHCCVRHCRILLIELLFKCGQHGGGWDAELAGLLGQALQGRRQQGQGGRYSPGTQALASRHHHAQAPAALQHAFGFELAVGLLTVIGLMACRSATARTLGSSAPVPAHHRHQALHLLHDLAVEAAWRPGG